MDPSVNQAPDIGPVRPEAAPQQQTPEKPTTPSGEIERAPERPTFGPEKVSRPEQQATAQPVAPVATSPPVVSPGVTAAQPLQDDTMDDDTPALAQDVDVIEKEWVNKAKAVIAQTKDNPHAQEAAFEKLQTEYLKKRYGYGKDVGAAA